MPKQNCWEFMRCGKQLKNKRSDKLELCPATIETKTDGVHGGKNGGRCCWAISGTLCEGGIQDTVLQKYQMCTECGFYKLVTTEEKIILTSSTIMKKYINTQFENL